MREAAWRMLKAPGGARLSMLAFFITGKENHRSGLAPHVESNPNIAISRVQISIVFGSDSDTVSLLVKNEWSCTLQRTEFWLFSWSSDYKYRRWTP